MQFCSQTSYLNLELYLEKSDLILTIVGLILFNLVISPVAVEQQISDKSGELDYIILNNDLEWAYM